MSLIEYFEGNLADAPTLEATPSGKNVTTAVVLVNNRVKVKGEWTDGPPTRRVIKAWGIHAHPLATLTKGASIVVIGKIITETWEDSEGKRHWREQVQVQHLGASLRDRYTPAEDNETDD